MNTDEILEDLEFFDTWEDRYKYIIDLGKELAPMSDELKTPVRLVKGCQSNVWLEPQGTASELTFLVDSDAVIVRGLLALVIAAFSGKSAQQIIDFDIDGYFTQLDLANHLSPTRGNGLKAIVGKIQAIARAAA